MKNDYQTSTVDGAAGFAKMYAEKEEIDYYAGEDSSECPDEDEPWEMEECNCSDPGCPCGGSKRMYW